MTRQNEPGNSTTEKLYTIGTVSKLTGVGAITLRAWERRYELIHPVRKESGHRLYTRTHIDQINRITALTGQGMRISQISLDMLESAPAGNDRDVAVESLWATYLDNMISAIIAFDEARLEEIYNEVLSLYPIELATRKLLKPLLIELGLRWETANGSIAEEHFFAFYLRNKLGARFHHRLRSEAGPRVLLAGLPGEYHEIALLLFALVANSQGFRLLPLGANMPLHELAYVAKQAKCDAIVLSGAIAPASRTLTEDLTHLVEVVEIPVFVGGPASVFACDAINKAGAEALGQDMEHGLRRLKERLAQAPQL
jgi:DNA-binding transcriptional MerR regulator/methylmalonyl-CoA mutase cobalamin-binding subunit